jgi:hypothetical protein
LRLPYHTRLGLLSLLTVFPLFSSAPDFTYTYTYSTYPGAVTDNLTIFTSTGGTPPLNNGQMGCIGWQLLYNSNGLSGVSVNLQSAPSGQGGAVGAWSTFSGTNATGSASLPMTATSSNAFVSWGYFPWIRVNVATLTGTGSVNIQLSCWKSVIYAGGLGGDTITSPNGTLSIGGSSSATTLDLSFPILAPAGSNTAPSFSFSGASNSGLYNPSSSEVRISINGTDSFRFLSGSTVQYGTSAFLWGGGATITSADTGFCRQSAGVVEITTSGTCNALGSLQLTGLAASGSSITLSGLSASTGSPSSLCLNSTTVTVNAALTCTVSNENVKNHFIPLKAPILDLMKLKPAQFEYNDAPGRLRWGFGAKQVSSVDRAMGDGWREDGQPWSLDQNAILALAVKTIQSQQIEIDKLNKRLNKLEKK